MRWLTLIPALLGILIFAACAGSYEDAEPAESTDGTPLSALPTCGMPPKDMVGKTMTPTPVPGKAIVSGDRNSNLVALTFELPRAEGAAMETMAWLSVHHVPAAVFMPAALTEGSAELGRQVLRMADARPDLFSLGNAGYSRTDFRSLSAGAIASELTKAELALDKFSRQDPRPFFRPLSAQQDASVVTAAAAAGYTYTVLWDVDATGSLDGGPAQLAASVLDQVRGGSIIRLDLAGEHVAEALPLIIDGLAARGLEPVSLERLLGY